MKKCSYAARYQALYPPQCDHGRGCDACREKWRASESDRERDEAAVRNFDRRMARAAVLAREDVERTYTTCEDPTLATLAALAALDAEHA